VLDKIKTKVDSIADRLETYMALSLFRFCSFICLTTFLFMLILPSQSMGSTIQSTVWRLNEVSWLQPADFRKSFRSGNSEIAKGNYQKALTKFTQAIELKPDFASAYANRCLVEIELQNYSNAERDCTKALTIKPDNESAYLNRGLAHYRLGEYTEAIADYDRLLNWKADCFEAYYNRGLAREALQQYTEALTDYDRALGVISSATETQLTAIYSSRGSTYFSLGKYDKAIEDFDRSLGLNPNNIEAYYNRACACHRRGDNVSAIIYFTKAIDRDSTYAEAYTNRGLIYYQLGDRHKAFADLTKSAQYFSDRGKTKTAREIKSLIERLQRNNSSEMSAIA
jgi:tetratricopeptide (TPR) repeat protein